MKVINTQAAGVAQALAAKYHRRASELYPLVEGLLRAGLSESAIRDSVDTICDAANLGDYTVEQVVAQAVDNMKGRA